MPNEYDIERYDREREERIKHLETLKEQAEEEFNSYHNDKRESFEYEYEEEEYDPSAKKKLIGLASVALLGVAGYFGYNSLSNSNETPKTEKITVENQAKSDDDVKTQIASIVSDAMKRDDKQQNSVDVSKMVEEKSLDTKESKKSEAIEPDVNNQVNLSGETLNSNSSSKTDTSSDTVVTHIAQPIRDTRRVVNSSNTYKKKKYKVITVRKGDTLASIAEKYYGNPMYYKKIARANKIWRSSRLKVGQKIIIPQLDDKVRKRLYKIRRGDTLRRISKKFYGTANKVQKIVKANYKIKSAKSKLKVGDIIYIPK